MRQAVPVMGVLLLWLFSASAWAAPAITDVYHAPASFDPAEGESVAIRFTLSEPADVALEVFDVRDLRIARLEAAGLQAGNHTVSWKGQDAKGRAVPPEAYHYVLSAAGEQGSEARWDPSDQTGGEVVKASGLRWDPAQGTVRYALPQDARVRLRVGLEHGGPLLRTVLDWVPRGRGTHEEAWDGKDASGLLDLSEDPRLALQLNAFSLPRNAVFVEPAPAQTAVIDDLPEPAVRRPPHGVPPPGRSLYARQPLLQRQDFQLELALDGAEARDGRVPSIRGPVAVRVDVPDEHRQAMLDQRFEVMFFIDGTFVFENEVGFLPMTWTWDPAGVAPGLHHLTANLQGYEGQFGVQTVAVQVERGRAQEASDGSDS